MAFTTQTKIHLNNAHVSTCLDDTLNLSGSTYFGTNAAYSTGMTDGFNANTIPDVAYVTGQTATKLNTSIFNGYTGATQTMYNAVGDPTGFVDNENIAVTYDSGARTITLTRTGGVEYYWRGKKYTLASPWTSPAHTNDTNAWYLYSNDGVNFAWSTAVWDFDDVQVAVRPANTTWAIREVHGTMGWETHEELHNTIGTYRLSGFGLTNGTYQIQPASPVDADNTPGFQAGNLADEDLQTVLPAWTEGSYTQLHFTSTGTVNFAAAQSNLFRIGTTYPNINFWNGTTFSEVETSSGKYFNYYVIRIPVTADAGSQTYRAVVLQPQFEYESLAAAQAESPLTINLGNFTNLAPEYVFVERITLHTDVAYTSTGKVRIEAQSILTGAKFNQTSTTPGAGSVTAGNVSVTPLSPFTETNMQTLSDAYAQCFNALSSGSISSANNGLTKVGTNVVLGGALTGNTIIGSGTCLLGVNANAINLTGATVKINGSSAVCLVTAPGAGDTTDSILVRDTTGVIQQVSFATVTGNTYSKACIDAYTGATDSRLDTIETTYITGGTGGLTKVGQNLCLGGTLSQVNSGTISDSRTDTVGIVYGGDYEADFVARSLVTKQYVTGLTSNSYTKAQIDAYTGATDTRLDGIESNITYISGQTDLKLNTSVYAAYTASTETRLDTIEEDYVTGATGGIYKTDCHTVSLTTANQAILTGALTGVTGTHLGTSGRNVCLDATAVCIVDNALTGSTNGLTNDGRTVKLGGALTETTTISGSQTLNVTVNVLNLTGATTGIKLAGNLFATDLIGGNDLVCVNTSTGELGTTSLSAFGGITGGTNGICNFSNQRLGLGGVLTQDSTICGAGFDLNLGSAASKLDVLNIQAAGTSNITTGGLTVCSSGGTITDLRAVKEGICYAGDYSSSFVGNSLVTKCYVDTVAAGLQPHDVVRVATTADIDLNGAETIDGIAVSNGDRVLVKNQNTASQNGIYVVNTAGAWTRALDFDFTPAGEIVNGDLVPVFTGSTQANTLWVVTSTDPIASGDSINFTIFSRLLGVVAGDGIDVTPVGANQTISVDLMTNGGLAICSTQLAVADTIAGNGLSWSAGVINANATSGGVAGISVRYDGSDNLVVNAADISTALGGVLTGSTNGLTDLNGIVCLGGTLTQATTITGNDVCSLTYTDAAIGNKRGILYGGDYCATFVDRSLVDKAYVVRYTTGLTSALNTRVSALEIWSGATETRVDALEADINNLASWSGTTTSNIAANTADIMNLATWSGETTADIAFVSAATAANTADIAALAVWSGTTTSNIAANTADIQALGAISGITLVSLTGVTGTHLGTVGRNVCLDTTAITVINGALTGSTNGLTDDDRIVKLGGNLTEATTIGIPTGGTTSLYLMSTTGNGIEINSDYTNIFYFDSSTNSRLDVGANHACLSYVSDGGNYVANISTSNSGTGIYVCDGTCFTNSILNMDRMDVVSTYPSFSGITYGADYSANYTPRSLVDKEYVDNLIATSAVTASNGLTAVDNDIQLGGVLSTSTIISGGTGNTHNVLSLGDPSSELRDLNVYACNDVYVCGRNQVYLAVCGSDAYIQLNNVSDNVNISSKNDVNITADSDSATAGEINLTGSIVVVTEPTAGDSGVDSVLVRASDGTVKQIPSTSLGQNNNCYATTGVTSATLTAANYAVFVDTAAARTITLPASPTEGLSYKIKDCTGGALTNPITVIGSHNIDGAVCALINTDWGALNLTFSNGAWYAMGFIN